LAACPVTLEIAVEYSDARLDARCFRHSDELYVHLILRAPTAQTADPIWIAISHLQPIPPLGVASIFGIVDVAYDCDVAVVGTIELEGSPRRSESGHWEVCRRGVIMKVVVGAGASAGEGTPGLLRIRRTSKAAKK